MKLEQELQDSVKKYQQEASQNATVMNEMQETINSLRWQLLESGSPIKQVGVLNNCRITVGLIFPWYWVLLSVMIHASQVAE